MDSADSRRPASMTLACLLALAVGAVAFLFSCQKMYDADTWWHLATGRWVVENGRVPTGDIFSFATAGAPWVAYSWLPATGMYAVFAAGGPKALVLLKAALVAAAFVLAVLLAARARIHPWLAAVALTLAIPIAWFQFRERPHVLMFALVALFFWLLAEPGAERRRRTWVVLGLAQVLWANVHGSFFLGIALTGALFTERLLQLAAATLRRDGERDRRGLLLSGALLVLVSVASLATPYGTGLLAQTIGDMTALSVARSFSVEEFQPLSPARYPGFVAYAVGTAASFLVGWRSARPFTIAVFLGLAALAVGSQRFAAIAAFVFAFILATNVQPLLERIAGEAGRRGRLPSARVTAAVLTCLMAVFSVAAFRGSLGPGREAQFGLGVNESRFPGPAVQFLAQSGFEGNLFNSWVHGGYVLWHLPKAKDLVDGRALPAHLALLDRLSSMGRAALDRWLEENDVRGALLTRDDAWLPLFAQSQRYTRVFFDDRAVVFLRGDREPGGPVASGSFRFIKPELYDPSYLVPIARGPSAPEAEAEIRRAVADAPGSFSPRFLLGFFLEAQGRPEALEHYVAAARLNAGLAFAHYDLGRRVGALALATGQAPAAEPVLRQAVEVKKDDPVLEAFLGSSLYVQKKLPEAEELLQRALARAPDLPVALTNLGYLFIDTGRATKAVPLFERAVATSPRDEPAAFGRALALQKAGRRPEAAQAWREFLERFPASAWGPKARRRLAEVTGG